MNMTFSLSCVFSLFLALGFCREPQIHVCTVASQESEGFHQLLDSCDRYGIAMTVLGKNKPLLGLSHKLIYLEEYLETLKDRDIVLYVDADDVLFLASSEKIKQKFLEMNVPFLISVERFCWPDAELKNAYPIAPTTFKYINSGSFIGYVDQIKQILFDIDAPTLKNDQGLLTHHYFEHPELYAFDYHCELFLPLAGVIPQEINIDLQRKTLSCTETGSKPCLIRGNGGSRPIYQEVYNQFYHSEHR